MGTDQFPRTLYKGFAREHHARAFCAGKIRFATLRHYRETEDGARSDGSEGIGVINRPVLKHKRDPHNGRVHVETELERVQIRAPEDECFVCCFSLANESLPSRFGRFYVEITAPARLFRDIQGAIQRDPLLRSSPPGLEAGVVRYDKGRYVGDLSDPEEIRALPWLQKPAYYAEENEYRLHFHCSNNNDLGQSHTLEIGEPLDYCRLLQLGD